jgi:hypothetical protein
MTLPAPMSPAPTASVCRIAVAACLVLAVGIVSAQTRPLRKPAPPADLAKQREQNVESPQSKADKAAQQPASAQPASTEVIKQREQELDSLRAEQQQAAEAEQ